MPDEQTIIDAIDLTERILEEVTSAEQDWSAIEQMASTLAELAGRAARGTTGPETDAGTG